MGEPPRIDIRPDHWAIVRDILRKHVPQHEVWAFGSRAKWTAKQYSDLDLAVIGDQPLPLAVSAGLSDDFSESDLPYRVDVVDWATTSESFRKIIQRDRVVVQPSARGWASQRRLVRLGDHVEACLGKMLDAQKNRGSLQPYLGNSNVRWGTFDLQDLGFMRFEDHEEARYGIQKGDLIICEGGEPGRCAIWHDEVPGMKIQKALHRVRARNGLDNQFLYYWFLHAGKTGALEPFFTGTTIKHLTGKALAELRIPLPPMREQQALAKVLRSLDEKIELNRSISRTLEAMAQAIFKSWFVDFDPVKAKIAAKAEGRDPLRAAMCAISGKTGDALDALPADQLARLAATAALFPDEMQQSTLGEIPRGWTVEQIREVVEAVYDGPHATPPEATAGPVFLGIRNLTGTALDLGDIRHISESDWAQWTRRVVPRAGDIVFSYEATLGHFALLPPDLRCCLGRRLALIRPRAEQGHGTFWFHQFVASPFQRHLEKHTVPGATVNRIALKDFPSFPVLRPSIALQAAFAAHADPAWSTIHSRQAESRRLAELRDTLLSKLLSGEVEMASDSAPAWA